MATHQKGYKYIVSGSIDNTLGTILDARHKELGVNKSFEIEQGLRLYYERLGLITKTNELKNVEGLKVPPPIAQPPSPVPTPTTTTPTSTHTGTLEVDRILRDMATTEGSRCMVGGGIVDVNRK